MATRKKKVEDTSTEKEIKKSKKTFVRTPPKSDITIEPTKAMSVTEYLSSVGGKNISIASRKQCMQILTLIATGQVKDGFTNSKPSTDQVMQAIKQLATMILEDEGKGDDKSLFAQESNANKVIMEQIGNSTIDDIVNDCNKEVDESANAATPTND